MCCLSSTTFTYTNFKFIDEKINNILNSIMNKFKILKWTLLLELKHRPIVFFMIIDSIIYVSVLTFFLSLIQNIVKLSF